MAMAETKMAHQPSTNIPFVTSHPTRIAVPPSKPSLIPSSRKIPTSIPTPTPSLTHSGPVPANHAIRSLRNLLPFGPGKAPNAASTTTTTHPNIPKSPFLTFGSVRRSMTGERKNSLSYSRPEENSEPPVISIHPSNSQIPNFKSRVESKSISPEASFSPPNPTKARLPPPSPILPLSNELSTISEADTSGISKHVPPLEDLKHPDTKDILSAIKPITPSETEQPDPFRPDVIGEHTPDDSIWNLSTSGLKSEVLEAMAKDKARPSDWLNDPHLLVIDEVEQTDTREKTADKLSPDIALDERNANISLDLGELDPDLAALLSPNNLTKNDVTITASHRLTSKSFDLPRASSQRSPRMPSPHGIESQSSPKRRSLTSARPPSSTLPRFRSVSGQSTPMRANKELPLLPAPIPTPGSPNRDIGRGRSSSDSIRQRQQTVVGPMASSVDSYVSGTPASKLMQSRFATPARYASYSGTGTKRPRPGHAWDVSSTSTSSPGSSSLGKATARAEAATATNFRSLRGLRPSLDSSEARAEIAERDGARFLRSRKRSMSLEDHRVSSRSMASSLYHQTRTTSSTMRPSSSMSNVRPTYDYHTRGTTGRSFTTGESFELDRDTVDSRLASGSVGSGLEREYSRSNRPPSRMAFSEASGPSSSRARTIVIPTDTGGSRVEESPTMSSVTPRTHISAGSTAGTSVSGVSLASAQQQQRMHIEMQSLKEKHELETEALLAALSDSQRLTKMLRDENRELRERIQELEDQLERTLCQMQRYQDSVPTTPRNHLPSARLLSRTSFESRSRSGSPSDVQRHFQSRLQSTTSLSGTQSHSPSFKMQARDPSSCNSELLPSTVVCDLVTKSTDVKRLSSASSVFPTPPSNMAMLMSEEGVSSLVADRSSASAFSTGSISPPPPLLSKGSGRHSRQFSVPTSPTTSTPKKHRVNRSVSSGGDTTANFSMTEATGSPGSLRLRPEHELHLGDMVSLDLGYHASDGGDESDEE